MCLMVQIQQTVYGKHMQFFVYPLYLSKSVQKFSIGPTQTAAAPAKLLQLCLTVQRHRWQSTSLLCPWDSLGKSTGMGCHFLLQPTQTTYS